MFHAELFKSFAAYSPTNNESFLDRVCTLLADSNHRKEPKLVIHCCGTKTGLKENPLLLYI